MTHQQEKLLAACCVAAALTRPYATHSVPFTQLMTLSGQCSAALFRVASTWGGTGTDALRRLSCDMLVVALVPLA